MPSAYLLLKEISSIQACGLSASLQDLHNLPSLHTLYTNPHLCDPQILCLNGSHDRETASSGVRDGPMTASDIVQAVSLKKISSPPCLTQLSHPFLTIPFLVNLTPPPPPPPPLRPPPPSVGL